MITRKEVNKNDEYSNLGLCPQWRLAEQPSTRATLAKMALYVVLRISCEVEKLKQQQKEINITGLPETKRKRAQEKTVKLRRLQITEPT